MAFAGTFLVGWMMFTSGDDSGATGRGDCTNTQGTWHLNGLIFRMFFFGVLVCRLACFSAEDIPQKLMMFFYLRVGPVFLGRMEGVYTASA